MIDGFEVYTSPDDYASFPGIIRGTGGIAVPFTRQPLDRLRASSLHPHYAPVAELIYAVSRDQGKSWAIRGDLPPVGGLVHATRHGHMVDFALSGNELLRFRRGYEPGTMDPMPLRADVLRAGGAVAETQVLEDFGPFERFHPFAIERLSDGSLLAGGYSQTGGPADRDGVGNNTALFLKGSPDGRQWAYCSHIANPNPFHFTEMHALDMGHGRIVCMLRTDWVNIPDANMPEEANGNGLSRDGYGYFLYQSESADFGQTWSTPRRLGIWGHPPFCLKLQSGSVVMVYGHRRPPFEIRAVVSTDGCRTWDLSSMTTLHRFDPGGYDIGYPVCTELEDGRLLCVFYGYATEGTKEKAAHAILGARFTESDLRQASCSRDV